MPDAKNIRLTLVLVATLLAAVALIMRLNSCGEKPQPSSTVTTIHDTTIVTVKEYAPVYRDRIRNIIHRDTLLKYIARPDSSIRVHDTVHYRRWLDAVRFTDNLIAASDTLTLSDGGLLQMRFYDSDHPFAYWHKPNTDTTVRTSRTELTKTTATYNIRNKSPTVALTVGYSPLGINAINGSPQIDLASFRLGIGVVLWSY
ncbi:MAG: hypothetical protein JNL32_06845 [Candidatus Kapabacteria bacterium]|nr:hypothetical protein [Candidatus Kapabacteria bacterium]